MAEELGPIPELVHLKSVEGLILLDEEVAELGLIDVRVKKAEPLRKEAVEAQVGSLLCAALENHVTKLNLLPLSDIQLQKLVTALLKVD